MMVQPKLLAMTWFTTSLVLFSGNFHGAVRYEPQTTLTVPL